MSNSGNFVCLSKQTIAVILECILSCILFVAVIYFILFIINVSKANGWIEYIGIISIVALISTTFGFCGSQRDSYCGLFSYFILASYHLYFLAIYVGLTLKLDSSSQETSSLLTESSRLDVQLKSKEVNLHQLTVAFHIFSVVLSLVMVCFKIISLTSQIDSGKVIVLDNNPVD